MDTRLQLVYGSIVVDEYYLSKDDVTAMLEEAQGEQHVRSRGTWHALRMIVIITPKVVLAAPGPALRHKNVLSLTGNPVHMHLRIRANCAPRA